jgi:ArsR family transcriptional regulator
MSRLIQKTQKPAPSPVLAIPKKVAQNSDKIAEQLKMLSNPHRLRILCLLCYGEKTVSDIEAWAGISQSLTSQCLNKMRLEGLIKRRKERTLVFYSLKNPMVGSLIKSLYSVFCS